MEIRAKENFLDLTGKESYETEIKVRGDDNFEHYLFPKEILKRTIAILQDSKIYYEAISADSKMFENLALRASRYSVEEYDESEVWAFNCQLDMEELYELICYINDHREEKIHVSMYKNSELPEFQNLLSEDKCILFPEEVKIAMHEYMKMLLDLSDSERIQKIMAYSERAKFGCLLNYYNSEIQEFILKNVTKRMETALREEMKEQK